MSHELYATDLPTGLSNVYAICSNSICQFVVSGTGVVEAFNSAHRSTYKYPMTELTAPSGVYAADFNGPAGIYSVHVYSGTGAYTDTVEGDATLVWDGGKEVSAQAILASLAVYAKISGTGTVTAVTGNGDFTVSFDAAYTGNTNSLCNGKKFLSFTSGPNQWDASLITGGTLTSSTTAHVTFTVPFGQTVSVGNTFAIITN